MRAKVFVVLALVAAMSSACATVVGGTAEPGQSLSAPGPPDGVPAGEPCALLEPEEAAELGLTGGEFRPGEPDNLIPPTCRWSPAEADGYGVTVGFAVDLPLADYMDGVQPEEEMRLGGLTWGRYPDPLEMGTCFLATELSETSFVVVLSSASDLEEACDLVKDVAPYLSSHLPGGR